MIFSQVGTGVLRGNGFHTRVQEAVKTQAKIPIQTVDSCEHIFLFKVIFFCSPSCSQFFPLHLHNFMSTVRGHQGEMHGRGNVSEAVGPARMETTYQGTEGRGSSPHPELSQGGAVRSDCRFG